MRYPRNLQGYGGTPPNADWPGGAKVAVSLVLNYEEGGENSILHGDAASEGFLSEIPGAAPWPGQRHWNMEIRLRIRRPRRLLAPPPPPPRPPRHHLRRRLRAGPLPRPGRRHAGRRLGDRLPRPALDRLPQPHPRSRTRRPRGSHPPPHRGHGRAPEGLVHRPHLRPDRRPRLRDRPLRLDRRHLRRRPPLLARARRPPAAHHPLHPRDQRHAVLRRDLHHLRGLLHLPPRHLRHPLRRRRGRRAQDDVRRPPLPPRRPTPAASRAWPTSSPTSNPSPASGSPPAATSPPTGAPATPPRPSPTAPPPSPGTPSSSATAASSSTPPGSPSAPSTSSSALPTTPPPASPAR